MQVSSARSSSLANLPLSLHSAKPDANTERSVGAIVPRIQAPEYSVPSPTEARAQQIDLDPGTEKKLSRIKEVQIAFQAAMNLTDHINSQFLLDPIV